jgi:Cu-processing system permease protein
MTPVLRIAWKEAQEAAQSRWLWGAALLLAILPLLISAAGLGIGGAIAPNGLARTTASMVSLAIYLVPLVGIQLAHGSVVAEAERGTLWILLAQPLPRWKILAGKFAGLGALLAVLVGGSFSVAGALVAARAGWAGAGDYAAFVASSIGLGFCFVGIGLCLSTFAHDRAQAVVSGIALWLFFSLVLDLLLLLAFAALSAWLVAPGYSPSVEMVHRELASGFTGDEARFPWMSALVLLNPTDVFRLWNVLRVPEMRSALALTRSLPAWLGSPWTLAVCSLAWIAAPLGLAAKRFARVEPG